MSIEAKYDSINEVLAAAELRRITDADPEDIFVAGYPKSGNTWIQYLLAGVIFGIDARLAPDSLVQDLVPDVHFREFYKRYLTPTFFKTHDLPQPRHRRVVYLVRDGRDVMVSYFHHLNALGNPINFIKLVATGEGLFPCRWHEHIEAWMANPHNAQMITISYEMLKRDAVAVLEKICEFAGIERERTILKTVVQNSNFENLRKAEMKFGWADSRWPKDKAFIRRGEVGSFRDEMPQAALNAFLEQSSTILKRLGYL